MKDYLHLLKYSLKLRKYHLTLALLTLLIFLIVLLSPVGKMLNENVLTITMTWLAFSTILNLFPNEINLNKAKNNTKDNPNTSLLYHFSLLKKPRVLIYVSLTELFIESLVISIFCLFYKNEFSFYLKSIPVIFFIWFLIRSSSVLFSGKRIDFFISKKKLNRIDLFKLGIGIIALFLLIYFLSNTKMDLFNYIEPSNFLRIIFSLVFLIAIRSSINALETDSTPKIFTAFFTLFFLIAFLVFSFIIADPFYKIYRQDQYVFSLLSKGDPVTLDTFLKNNPTQINSQNNYASTPLIKALYDERSSEIVLALLKHRPNLKFVLKYDGNSALALAVKNCQLPVIKELIKQGIDVNLKNQDGVNSIFAIHKNDCFEAYPLLKEAKIDLTIKNNDGLNFLEYGLKHNKRFKDNFEELNNTYQFKQDFK